jgi:hypothetical protein
MILKSVKAQAVVEKAAKPRFPLDSVHPTFVSATL